MSCEARRAVTERVSLRCGDHSATDRITYYLPVKNHRHMHVAATQPTIRRNVAAGRAHRQHFGSAFPNQIG